MKKKFLYRIEDPHISSNIEVDLKECKTVGDLKKKISFNLHIFNYQLIIDYPPLDKELTKIPEYHLFKIRIEAQRCKDIDFDLPNKKIIHIKDCYRKKFPEIIESFREKKIHYSNDCVKNIHFKVNKQEVPHIEYPLLAVPSGTHVIIEMSCQVTAIQYGYNQFIFTTNETVFEAEKVFRKIYEGCSNISILNDLMHKLKPDDKFRFYSKYTLNIDFKITFKHISSQAESIHHLDFLATVQDAKKQLAIVYSNNGQLGPENIILYNSLKIPIDDTRKTLKSIQNLGKNFYFDIDKKKKFHEYVSPHDPQLNIYEKKNNSPYSHQINKLSKPRSMSPEKYKNTNYNAYSNIQSHSKSPNRDNIHLSRYDSPLDSTDSNYYQKSKPKFDTKEPLKYPNPKYEAKEPIRKPYQKLDNKEPFKKRSEFDNDEIFNPKNKKNSPYYSNESSKQSQNTPPQKVKVSPPYNKHNSDDDDDEESYESTKMVIHLNNNHQLSSSSSSAQASPKGAHKSSFNSGSFNGGGPTKLSSSKKSKASDNEYDQYSNTSKSYSQSHKSNANKNSDDDDIIRNRSHNSKQAKVSDVDDSINNYSNNSKQKILSDDDDDDNYNITKNSASNSKQTKNNNDNDYSISNDSKQNILSDDEEEDNYIITKNSANNSQQTKNDNDNDYSIGNNSTDSKQNVLSDDDDDNYNITKNSANNSKQDIINDDDNNFADESNSLKLSKGSHTNDDKLNNSNKTDLSTFEEEEENNVYTNNSSSYKKTKNYDFEEEEEEIIFDDDNSQKSRSSHKSGKNSVELDAEQQSDQFNEFIIEEEEEENDYSQNKSNKSISLSLKLNKYYFQTNRDCRVSEIDLDSDATVKTMKMEIAEKNRIKNINNIKILFAGKELLDDLVLEEQNIGDTNLFIYIRSEDDINLMASKALQYDNNNQLQPFEEEDIE